MHETFLFVRALRPDTNHLIMKLRKFRSQKKMNCTLRQYNLIVILIQSDKLIKATQKLCQAESNIMMKTKYEDQWKVIHGSQPNFIIREFSFVKLAGSSRSWKFQGNLGR